MGSGRKRVGCTCGAVHYWALSSFAEVCRVSDFMTLERKKQGSAPSCTDNAHVRFMSRNIPWDALTRIGRRGGGTLRDFDVFFVARFINRLTVRFTNPDSRTWRAQNSIRTPIHLTRRPPMRLIVLAPLRLMLGETCVLWQFLDGRN